MMEDDYCDEDEEEMAMMREQMRDRRNMFMEEGEEDEEMMEIDEGSRHQMPRNEETKGPKVSRVLERCKEVGRVGPNITKMDPDTMSGNVKIVESSSGND